MSQASGRPASRPSSASRRSGHCRRAPRTAKTFALAFLAAMSSTALAYRPNYPPLLTRPAALDFEASTLVVDTFIPAMTQPPTWNRLSNSAGVELRRRQRGGRNRQDDEDEEEEQDRESEDDGESQQDDGEEDDSDDQETTSSEEQSTRTTSEPSTDSPTATTTTSSTTAAETGPLPSAFDMTPSSSFRGEGEDDSCPTFMSNLFASTQYKQCYPLSMMLQTSNGLFEAERDLTSIVRVLDATCSADVEFCTAFFDEAALNLTQDANCGAEFEAAQPLVLQAFSGLRAYESVYGVSCLQDPETDMYCFATSVTNTTEPSDTYFYFLPLGTNMPGGSRPSCGWCTTETMEIYNAASADRSQAIAETYENASQQVNTICGPNFVDVALAEEVTDAAAHLVLGSSLLVGLASLSAAAFLGLAL